MCYLGDVERTSLNCEANYRTLISVVAVGRAQLTPMTKPVPTRDTKIPIVYKTLERGGRSSTLRKNESN